MDNQHIFPVGMLLELLEADTTAQKCFPGICGCECLSYPDEGAV